MLMSGASMRLSARSRVSSPWTAPYAVAARRSHVAASPIGDGSAVAGGWVGASPGPTPAGPLVMTSGGMPSRGTPGTRRRCCASRMPCSSEIFSSSVMAATRLAARRHGSLDIPRSSARTTTTGSSSRTPSRAVTSLRWYVISPSPPNGLGRNTKSLAGIRIDGKHERGPGRPLRPDPGQNGPMDPLLLSLPAAFGLAAASGLNASLPLLLVSLAARIGLLHLAHPYDAIASDVA